MPKLSPKTLLKVIPAAIAVRLVKGAGYTGQSAEYRVQRVGFVSVLRTLHAVLLLAALTGVFLYTRAGAPAPVQAATSSHINFQARLLSSSGAIVPDGDYNVEFKLYDSQLAGGSNQGVCAGGVTDDCLWVETRTSTKVTVKNGYLSVHLGDTNPLPSNIDWDQDLYLSMRIGGTGSPAWDTEMTPRLKLTAVPYAFESAQTKKVVSVQGANTGTLEFDTLTDDRSILLPNASGTVCLTSGNCAGSGGNGDILQGGNTLGETVVLGSNDEFGLELETDGVTRMTISATGLINLSAYDCSSLTNNGKLTVEADGDLVCANEDGGGGGSTTTLQQAYDNDTDDTNAIITLTSTDGELLVRDASTPLGGTLFAVQSNDGATTYLEVTATGITTSGDLAVNGGDITSTGALTITPNAGTNLNVALSGTGDFAVNTNQLYVDTSTGHIGVGIALPTYKLHISGDYAYSAGTNLTGNVLTIKNASNTNQLQLASDGTNNVGIIQAAQPGVGYRNLVLQPGGGNVGIGTTGAPNQLLSVGGTTGNFLVNSSGQVTYVNGTSDTATQVCRSSTGQLAACQTNVTGSSFVQGGNSFGAQAVLGTNDAFGLAFETGGTTRLTVTSGGNVGVGTSGTPSHLLSVGGTTGNFTVDNSGNTITAGTVSTTSGGAAGTGTQTLASNQYVQSRGMNLVANGTGLLGNNYNFSTGTFDQSDTFTGKGSFLFAGNNITRTSDELIPVDPGKHYELSLYAKSTTYVPGNHSYFGIVQFDVDGAQISPQHHMYQANTTTTLAAPLNPGDTTVQLTSAANWNNAAGGQVHLRSIIAWGYTNSFGYTYPDNTYSRRVVANAYADGGVNYGTNTVTLSSPWPATWGAIPAGTTISNGSSGGTYKYVAAANAVIPNSWTKYSGVIGGLDPSGTNRTFQFAPGTANVKILALMNRDVSGNVTNLSTVSLTETTGRNTNVINLQYDNTTVGLTVQGASGQSADLLRLQNSVGAVLAAFNSSGALTLPSNGLVVGTDQLVVSGGNVSASGSLTVSGSGTFSGGSLTIGAMSQQGSLLLHDGTGGHTVTIRSLNQAANRIIEIPVITNDDEICLVALGNCGGSGGGVTGTGTSGQVAYFNGTGTITSDANFLFDGTDLTLGGDLAVNGDTITSDGTTLTINAAGTVDITDNVIVDHLTVGNSGAVTNWYQSGTQVITTDAQLRVANSGQGGRFFSAFQTGDANSRIELLTSGAIAWGDGAVAADVNLGRGAANRLDLASGDSLNLVSGNLQMAGTTVISSGRAIQNATAITSSGTITFSGLNSVGIVQTDASGVLSTGAVDRNSATLLSGTLNVANGGTGAVSLTAGGVLFGGGTGAITASGVLTNGQLLIGDGSGAPTAATLTGSGGVTVTNGAGTITISSDLNALDDTFFRQGGNSYGAQAVLGTNDAFGLAFETGGTTRLTIDTSGNANLTGNLTVGGRTMQLSNFNPDYRWRFANSSTDVDWKKIADVVIGTGLYGAASFQVDVVDANTNYGHVSSAIPLKYYVNAVRSNGVLDNADTGSVSGPIADYVRLVKTATGVYELQVRSPNNHRSIDFETRLIASGSATVTYVDNPANGATVGTIYSAIATGYTQNLASTNIAGTFTASSTSTFTGIATFNENINLGAADQIDFADEVGDKEYYFSTSYGRGIESNTLTDWTGARYRLRIGGTSVTTGTERLTVTSVGLKIGTGDATQALDVTGNGLFSGSLTSVGVNSGSGLIQGTGGLTVSGNATLAATAGNTASIGNATGALTLNGSNASTFVLDGTTITTAEFNILDGGINLASAEVAGVLPVANGGTGANSLNNLITLATHTTGDYIATITGNSQIGVAGSGGENAGVTLSIQSGSIGNTELAFDTGQHLTTTSTPTFGGLTLTATGNFTGWTAANTDIDGLLPGSTSGGLIDAPVNGHLVVSLRDNDADDGFYVLSENDGNVADGPVTVVGLAVKANGNVGIGTASPGSYRLNVQGGDFNVSGSISTNGTTRVTSAGVLQNVSHADAGNFFSAGTLTVNRGGTGIASYTVGDLIYASGTTTLNQLAAVATGSCLRSAGTGTAPVWGSCSASSDITGSGTSGQVAYFNGSQTLTSSANFLFNGNDLDVAGTLTAGTGDSFQVASGGNLTIGATSGTAINISNTGITNDINLQNGETIDNNTNGIVNITGQTRSSATNHQFRLYDMDSAADEWTISTVGEQNLGFYENGTTQRLLLSATTGNLDLATGDLLTNGTSRLTSAGVLQNITGYSQASGTFAFSGAGNFSIDSAAFDVTAAGAISGVTTLNASGLITSVGINSGSGLIQGTGGLTVTGTTSINASTNSATNINTGTSNALVTIGGGSGTFSLQTTNIDISSGGAITGATGLSTTGTVAISGAGNFSVDSSAFDVTTAGAVSGVTTLGTSGTITVGATTGTGLNFSNTGLTTDINLQNSETIDNDTDNRINFGFGAANGTLMLTSATSSNIANSAGFLTVNAASYVRIGDSTTPTVANANDDLFVEGRLEVDNVSRFENTLTVTAGGASIAGNTTIATTAGNTLGLGNATGAVTLTGSNASTFVLDGTTITTAEFNILDGGINLASAEVTGTLPVANGGTGAVTLTQYGVLFGNGTGTIQATGVGTTGQCLTGNTGAAPTWGSCSTASDITGSGTSGQVAYFNGTQTLTSSANFLFNGTDLDVGGTLTAGTADAFQINALGAITAATGINSSGTITFSNLTPDRLVATTTGGQLTNTITAANLASSVTGTTGTGNLVFSASPTFTGTVTVAGITNSGVYTANATSTRDKIRVWNSGTYTIGMQSAVTFGYLNDYAMTFQMNNAANRGWWWGADTHTQAQGAASLTTDGRFYVNNFIDVGTGYRVGGAAGAGQYLRGNGTNFVSSSLNASDLTGDVVLGSQTSGNYVATIAGDSQIGVSGSGAENAAVSLSIQGNSIGDAQLAFDTGQHLTATSTPTFAGLNLTRSAGDTVLLLEADTDNNDEADNPYIRFNQDGALISGVLGQTGNAGIDPSGAVYAGAQNNALLLGTTGSGSPLQLGTSGAVAVTFSDTNQAATFTNTVSGTQLISTVSTGTAPLTVASTTMVSNFNSNYLGGYTESQIASSIRGGTHITGGGTVGYNTPAAGVSWTARFLVISDSRGAAFSTAGYFDITQPANGTVITGANTSNITVTSGAIPLPAWCALYYILPIGSGSASLPANFRVVCYNGTDFNIPSNWVRIATHNSDNTTMTFANGLVLRSGQTGTSGTTNNVVFNTSVTTPLLTGAALNIQSTSGNITIDGSGTLEVADVTNIAGATTISATGTALTLSGAATTAINISNTGTTTDINLQNSETIDNDTNNRINFGFGAANGTLMLTSATSSNIANSAGFLTVNAASYVRIGDSTTPTVANANDDLFVEGRLEVDNVSRFENTLTVTAGGASIAGNTTIATTAGNTLGLGNATGAVTLTGSNASTFVLDGTTITTAEFNILDGGINLASAEVTGTLPVANGGTGAVTLTQYGVLFGNGVNAIGATAAGAAGQCLIANNAAAPSFQACTATGSFTLAGSTGSNQNIASGDTLTIAAGSNIATEAGTASDTLTVSVINNPTFSGLVTASNGFTLSTGALNLTATSGALTLSGLGASSISTGANNLIVTSGNFNTTTSGINSTAIGATTASTGAFTTLTATGAVNLNTTGTANTTIGNTAGGTITIGGASGSNLVLQDAQWGVTGAGAATFTSLQVNGDITTNNKSLLGTFVDNQPTNLLSNGNIETDISGWTGNALTTLARTTAESYFGSAALQLTYAGAGDGYAVYNLPSVPQGFTGRSYTFSFWAKSSTSTTSTSSLFLQGLSPTTTMCSLGTINLTTTWQKFKISCTVGANASTTWRAVLRPGSTGDTFFDGITVQYGTSGTEYTPINTADDGTVTLYDGGLAIGATSLGGNKLSVQGGNVNFGGNLTIASASGTGLNFSSASLTTDINLQNSETIDNDTDNRINFGFGAANGTLMLTSATSSSIANSAGFLTLNAVSYVRVGDSTTPTMANTNDDLFVEGRLEVDGVSRFENTLTVTTGGIAVTGNSTITGTLQSGNLTVGNTVNQQITLASGAGNHGVEIGRTDANASTPFIDFHSGATATDYDARIIASGGTGTNGQGALTLTAAQIITGGTFQYANGTSNSATLVCRNAAGQLAACQTNVTGSAFVQGGNDFGGNAILGTNTAGQTLTVETANTNRFVFSSTASTLTGQGTTTLDSTGSLALNTAAASTLTINTGNNGAGASGALGISSGTGTTSTGGVTINTGNATAGTSGNINIDNGTSNSGSPQINIGTANARAISLGNATATTVATFTAGATSFRINNTGVGINATTGTVTGAPTLLFGAGNHLININQSGAGTAGGNLTINAGQGNGAFKGGDLILQGGAQGSSGGSGSVIVQANATDITTAFTVRNAASTGILTVDTTSSSTKLGIVQIGSVTPNNTGVLLVLDSFDNTGAGEPGLGTVNGSMYYNSALGRFRCYENNLWKDCSAYNTNRTATLTPEFEGAVLRPDGSQNVGYMISDFCSASNLLNINTPACPTNGDERSYYEWSHNESAAQDYDIYVRWKVPDNFDSDAVFSSHVTMSIAGWRTDGTANAITVNLYNNAGQLCGDGNKAIATTSGTWISTSLTGFGGATAANCNNIDAGEYMTFVIKMTADHNTGGPSDIVRLGEIVIGYKSVF